MRHQEQTNYSEPLDAGFYALLNDKRFFFLPASSLFYHLLEQGLLGHLGVLEVLVSTEYILGELTTASTPRVSVGLWPQSP